MRFRTILISLIGFLLVFSFDRALAHGIADWIRQAPETAFCCGDQDCMPLPPSAVIRSRPVATFSTVNGFPTSAAFGEAKAIAESSPLSMAAIGHASGTTRQRPMATPI